MSTALRPTAAHIELATAGVMQRAVRSAVQLGNFPLQSGDIQCAFDVWAQELEQSVGLKASFKCDLKARTRSMLACLGYAF